VREPRLSVQLRVDVVCDRFEDAWQSGQRPWIADFVSADPDPALVEALIAIDVEYRRRTGTPAGNYSDLPGGDQLPTIDPSFSPTSGPLRSSSHSAQTFPFLEPSTVPGDLGRLGPYRILGLLGRGGMGAVFVPKTRRLAGRSRLK